jgi:dihydrofolate reductase
MSTVIANMSMSLDGFVEDRDGNAPPYLFRWTQSGPETSTMPGDGREFRTSSASARYLDEAMASLGSLVCGRRLFDLTHGWGGRHPAGVPVVVVTHQAPADWAHRDAAFRFVTDGISSAIEQAKHVAGDKTVAVASADVARQCLDLGLLDAISVDLVPVLLGAGTPWFAGISEVVELEDPDITAGDGVTHRHYRVRR